MQLQEQTITGTVSSDVIAPGTYGKINIIVDSTGTEVNLRYDLNINIENCPTNLKFYSDNEHKNLIETTRSGTGNLDDPKIAKIDITRYVDKDDNGVFDESIFWEWKYETTPGTAISEDDLVDSEDFGKTVTASIKVTGFEILDDIEQLTGKTAEVNGVKYDTLKEAIAAVPKNNEETTVKLLKNTSECITIDAGQNIVFNLQRYTLSNDSNNPVITNDGSIKITNGTIMTADNVTHAAINNNSGASIIMTGGIIKANGATKGQAIYNKGGTVEISGTAYLSAVTRDRATVQNLDGGILTITGGTIVSENMNAVNNTATLTIGTKDGSINKTNPTIQAAIVGVSSSTNYKFYDGVIKAKNSPIEDETKIVEIEVGYDFAQSEETIGGETYKISYLAETNTVTFDANDGTVSQSTKKVESGTALGMTPVPTRTGYTFEGWFTLPEGGEKVTKDTIITSDVTYFAHWSSVMIAEINGTQYRSLQAAVNDVPQDNTETTITLLKDTIEAITVKQNQNIKFDIQDYTISNKGNAAVIENNGTIEIVSGNITSNADTAAINNNRTGKLKVSGGSIVATGTRQAIYNNAGGRVEITGNAYLCSSAIGVPNGTTLDRATVHNLANGTVIITGGTIIGKKQQAVSNAGTLTIGTKDGNINTSSPVLIGETVGVESTKNFYYYDGIIKARTTAISGTITEQEQNSTIVNSTEVIDGKNYVTVNLQ